MPNTAAALGSPSYHLALDAARAAAGAQHYPAGALYVVAIDGDHVEWLKAAFDAA